MAKIGTAEIKTINITGDAATGYAEGTASATAVNEASGPVYIRAACTVSYAKNGQSTSVTFRITITRNSDSKVIAQVDKVYSGNDPYSESMGASGVDVTAGSNETYSATYAVASGTAFATATDKVIAVGWDKKH